MTSRHPDDALTEGSLARRLGVSVSALRTWRRNGHGPRFARFGRAVRYMPDDVEQYVRRSTVDSRAPEDSQIW